MAQHAFFTFLAQAVLAESSILDQVGDSSSFTVIPMVEQPKKAQTSYFLFLDAKKASFVEKAGGNYKQGISQAAKAWKALPPNEKKPFEDEAAKRKLQYEKDLKAFLDAGGEKKKRKSKDDDGTPSKRKKKDANAPKKPAGGAYGCYLAKNRAAFTEQCKGLSVTAVSKMAGEKWKKLSAAEKKPFEDEYAVKKKAYEEALAAYKASGSGGQAGDAEEDDEEEDDDGDA